MLLRTRLAPTLVAGALFLTACGRGDATADSAAAVAATDSAAGTTTPSGTSDPATSGAAGLSAANVASLIGLTNASEISAGKVAADKATETDVKAFARMMVTDHEAMQKSLDSLAGAKSITPEPPAQADQLRQQDSQTMSTLNSTAKGADFDKAYVGAQVQAHQKALTDLQTFAGATTDADLRALIEQAIPKVQAHLDRARQLQSKLGGS